MTTSLGGPAGYGNATGSSNALKGTGYRQVQTPNFTPEQSQLFQQLFSNVSPGSFTGRLASGDQSQFQQLEAPAQKQFGEQLGQIASRFSGSGLGGRRSSGFSNATSSAAADFAERLQAQRMGIQRQAIQDLMGMSNQLLAQRPFENNYFKEQLPVWQQMLAGLGGGAGQFISGAGNLGAAKAFGLF